MTAAMERGMTTLAVGLALGQQTLAEVTGMTQEQALEIARKGEALARAGRLEEAKVLFEGLVACNPRDPGCHAALGTLHEKLGQRQLAWDAFDRALALEPTHPVAALGRGELRLRVGDVRGIEDIRRAADADPAGRTATGRRAGALLAVLNEVGGAVAGP